MTMCFNTPTRPSIDESSIVLFSTTSDSNEESTTSSSSSHRHSPPLAHHHQTFNLSVTNLSFTIHHNKTLFSKPKQTKILNSVSFNARSSELLAVVGPSGTGKSTLLRAISGRVQDRYFDPKTISINGHNMTSPAQVRMICGYVAQQDDLLPLLTVRESLMFSARFRLGDTGSETREARVEALIMELGLGHVADSFVGDEEKRGISGGERKRVSIGVEIIHDPQVLVLDEPTSGLDSTCALQVIELLHSMAQSKQRTIIISIHQPSYRILRFVSEFLIMSRGSVAHSGTIEKLEERISQLGYQIPTQLNALEFAMEIITRLEQESHQKDSSNSHQFRSDISEFHPVSTNHNDCAEEIGLLCSRFCKIIYRTKQLLLARAMQAIVGGLGLGSVYVKLRKNPEGVSERLGFFAFSLSFLLSSTVEALPIYLQERRVIMKEISTNSYKISSYLIANTIVFLPFLLLVSLLFSIPVYWIVGLNPNLISFSFFLLVVWLIVLMASSLVLFLSAISPDFISGNSLISTVLGAFFLFSGYFIPKQRIPKYWMFMYYVSMYRYPLDAMLVNEYWNVRDDCFSWDDSRSRCVMNGRDVLMARGLDKDCRWMNVGIMLGFFVVYRVVCWIILAQRASKITY